MMTLSKLENKYVLHIPLTKFVNGELVDLDIKDIIDELANEFESCYLTRVESYYKARRYNELLITVFSDDGSVAVTFREWFLKYNHVLFQEAFAYEHNNEMIVEDLEF